MVEGICKIDNKRMTLRALLASIVLVVVMAITNQEEILKRNFKKSNLK